MEGPRERRGAGSGMERRLLRRNDTVSESGESGCKQRWINGKRLLQETKLVNQRIRGHPDSLLLGGTKRGSRDQKTMTGTGAQGTVAGCSVRRLNGDQFAVGGTKSGCTKKKTSG